MAPSATCKVAVLGFVSRLNAWLKPHHQTVSTRMANGPRGPNGVNVLLSVELVQRQDDEIALAKKVCGKLYQ